MDRLNTFDFALDENGDLVLSKEDTGDLSTLLGPDYLIQQIEIRIKESELEDLLGEPNTQEIAERGEQIILLALTEDGLLDFGDIYIEKIPLSKHAIHYFLFIKSPFEAAIEQNPEMQKPEETFEPIGFEISLHLSHGASLKRIT